MIKLFVKFGELLKGQIGNLQWISSAVDSVGIVRKDGLLCLALQERVGGGVNSLHFIVDHALVGEWGCDIFQFQMPSLLGVNHGIGGGTGMKHGITVDIDEVVKVLRVLTGHDVARSVGIGEGIQKCLQTPLQQLHEWILGLVLATAAQDAVFENVGNTRRVRRRRAEGNSKAFVVVLGGDGEDFGSALFVAIEGAVCSEFAHHVSGKNFKGGMSNTETFFEFRRHHAGFK